MRCFCVEKTVVHFELSIRGELLISAHRLKKNKNNLYKYPKPLVQMFYFLLKEHIDCIRIAINTLQYGRISGCITAVCLSVDKVYVRRHVIGSIAVSCLKYRNIAHLTVSIVLSIYVKREYCGDVRQAQKV